MAQDFTVKVGFDDNSMKKLGREMAILAQGLGQRATAGGSKQGMGGGAAESLVKMIPGGAFFTNIGKAFAQGGLFVGMAAGITSFVAIGKSLLSSSKVFQTMTGTFFKTIGAMIDMMLAPLMPLFMKFLNWWIREGFKWAQKAGQFLAEWLPRIADFLGSVISALGGIKPILIAVGATLTAWFTAWTIQKAISGVRGIQKLLGRKSKAARVARMTGGGRGAAAAQLGMRKVFGRKIGSALGRMGGMAIGGGGRLASGLASKTGAKAAARMGGSFLARRGASMGAGAAAGAGIGALGMGVGAIPGAVIGAVAGLVIGQAAGVAVDAAMGQEITVKSALIPGYSEFRDAKQILAAGDQKEWEEKAAQVKAMAAAQEAESARNLDQNYAALIGRPDSIVPSTMGTLIGVYNTVENRAAEVENNLKQQDTDDGGFWTGWGTRIKGYWNSAWTTIQGWWNKFFGDSPGAGTADGGNPDKDGVEYDGGTWWGDWLGRIGGFFKSAWGTVTGWWNKITGGAEDNEPDKNPPESGEGGGGIADFFSGVYGSIKTKFSDGWNKVKGWWNNIKDAVTDNEPDKDSDPKQSMLGTVLGGIIGAAGAIAGSIKDKFSKGWNKVKGWWSGLKDKVTENEPGEDSDPKDSLIGTALGNIIGGAKAIAGSIKDKFSKGWTKVKGWWQGLKDKVRENEPGEDSDPKESFMGTVLGNILGVAGKIGSTIKGMFTGGWNKVKGWWSGLKDKISDNQPDKDSDPVPNTISTTLSGIIGGGLKIAGAVGSTIKGLFTSGVSKVKGWWQGLKDKVDENKPTDADSSSALTTLGTNLGIIVGGIKTGLANAGNWIAEQAQKLHEKASAIPGYGAVTGFVGGWFGGGDDDIDSNNVGGQVRFKGGWQTGGVIPGPQGMLGLAAVHSGETILPTHLGPDWVNSTKGGSAFKRMMQGGMSGGWGSSSGGVNTTNMTMNRPTIINISTTESTSEVLTSLSQLEMLEDAAFFSSLA